MTACQYLLALGATKRDRVAPGDGGAGFGWSERGREQARQGIFPRHGPAAGFGRRAARVRSPEAGRPRRGRRGAVGAARRVTTGRVLRSEWIKLRSLRSTRVTLLVSFVLMAGIGVIHATVAASTWSQLPAAQKASFDVVSTVLTGYQFAQLAVGVLGVLVITTEYSSGMIRATLAAVPRRLPVLWAKAADFTVITLAAMTAASFAAFYAGMAALSGQHLNVALSAPGVLRAVIGTGLYLAVVGLLGVALGALLRSTAGAIASLVGADPAAAAARLAVRALVQDAHLPLPAQQRRRRSDGGAARVGHAAAMGRFRSDVRVGRPGAGPGGVWIEAARRVTQGHGRI